MQVHNLITQLQAFKPEALVLIVTPTGHEYEIEGVELAEPSGEVILEAQELEED